MSDCDYLRCVLIERFTCHSVMASKSLSHRRLHVIVFVFDYLKFNGRY